MGSNVFVDAEDDAALAAWIRGVSRQPVGSPPDQNKRIAMPRLERQGSELQMQGWLVKRKKSGETHIGGSRTKRFFKLCYFAGGRESTTGRDDQLALAYYRRPKDEPQEWLKVKDIQSVVSVLPTEFTVVHPKRSYVLRTASKEECTAWVSAILLAMRRAEQITPRKLDPTSPCCSSHSRDKRRILGSANRGPAKIAVERTGFSNGEREAFY